MVEQFTNQADSLIEQATLTRTPEKIRLRWIAAHNNILGNECTDKEAKKATARATSSNAHIPPFLQSPLPFSTESMKAQYMNKLKIKWREKWDLSPWKACFSNIDPDFPLNKFQKIIFKNIVSLISFE